MKFLTITKSKPIKLSVDTALKAGTPISITGEVANDDTAIGLVANDTAAGTESIAIVTEGMVDVNEIAASYGEALTDDCIAALKGITFLHGGKAVVPAGGGGLPDYSEASDGDVLSIEDGAPAWKEPSGGGGVFAVGVETDMQTGTMTLNKTWQEIYDAMASGKMVLIAQTMENIPGMGNMSAALPVIEAVGPIPQSGGGNAYAVFGITIDMSTAAVSPVGMKFATTSTDGYPASIMGG